MWLAQAMAMATAVGPMTPNTNCARILRGEILRDGYTPYIIGPKACMKDGFAKMKLHKRLYGE